MYMIRYVYTYVTYAYTCAYTYIHICKVVALESGMFGNGASPLRKRLSTLL